MDEYMPATERARSESSNAEEQKHRAIMTQQGAVMLLLQIHDCIAMTDKSTLNAASIEQPALAFRRPISYLPLPQHFSRSSNSTTQAKSTTSSQPSEALLALTNLASMEDDSPRNVIST
jgi:hypothetical protein